eukprot:gene8964-18552_t
MASKNFQCIKLFEKPSPEDMQESVIDDAFDYIERNANEKSPQLSERKKIKEDSPNNALKYFVPGFIIIWAIGYSTLAFFETTGGGLGDMGGVIGVSFVIILAVALVGVAAYESFKPDSGP